MAPRRSSDDLLPFVDATPLPQKRVSCGNKRISIAAIGLFITFVLLFSAQRLTSDGDLLRKGETQVTIPGAYENSPVKEHNEAPAPGMNTKQEAPMPQFTPTLWDDEEGPVAKSTPTPTPEPTPESTPIPSSTSSTSLKSTSTSIPKNAAAIVENRPLTNLIPVVLHFSSVLGPEWPIHIFTTAANMGIFNHSGPFKRALDEGRFHLRELPAEEALATHASVSGFFTKPWFWEKMAPAEHILLFQADSIICSNSPQKVEDFLEYDFVGAPIDEARHLGVGYNGGLSLRNRKKCLEITQTHNWQEERHGDHDHGNVDYEDQWFSKKMREMSNTRLPTQEVAKKFAVETIWYDKPLGYHQPNVWQPTHMEEIYNWCPEYRMCTTQTFKDHNVENFGEKV